MGVSELYQKVIKALNEVDRIFSLSDIVFLTQSSAKTVAEILNQLKKERAILSIGKGLYRKLERPVPIDFRNAKDEYVDIILPLDMNRLVKITKKSIVIVSGVTNAGKSAFLLNLIHDNMDKFDIDYYSSELNDSRLKIRLKCFEDVEGREIEWKFNAYELTQDYVHFINPNGISIIDYLEVYDNFYAVGGLVNEIFRMLKEGIVFIALQKNPHQAFGLGGSRSAEKAHLYISIDAGVLKIVKAKEWANPLINPNNMATRFKLYMGSKFYQDGKWYREIEKAKEVPKEEVF